MSPPSRLGWGGGVAVRNVEKRPENKRMLEGAFSMLMSHCHVGEKILLQKLLSLVGTIHVPARCQFLHFYIW